MPKKFYKVRTDVGVDWKWAHSPLQAVRYAWREHKSCGSKLPWRNAETYWTAEEVKR